jgi:hypothetical protein
MITMGVLQDIAVLLKEFSFLGIPLLGIHIGLAQTRSIFLAVITGKARPSIESGIIEFNHMCLIGIIEANRAVHFAAFGAYRLINQSMKRAADLAFLSMCLDIGWKLPISEFTRASS